MSKRAGQRKCWYCGGRGHSQRDCEALTEAGEGRRCFRCGAAGHMVSECPQPGEAPAAPPAERSPAGPRVKRVVASPGPGEGAPARPEPRMSVLITTSPVPSNPSTMMLEAVLNTFPRVKGLAECPLVIVCDGFRFSEKSTWKAGRVTEEAAVRYEEYLQRLEALLHSGRLPPGTRLVILDGRNGQAMAVRAGLDHVETPFVLVHQHDLEFTVDFKLSTVLDVLEDRGNDVKYVGMPLLTNLHYEAIAWQHHGVRVKEVEMSGIQLVPIVFWYDSTHITSVEHYRSLVFGPDEVYQMGNFVEETFGVRQRQDIMSKGMEGHPKYGTYHCLSYGPDGLRRPLICHLNGVRFLTPEQRAERGFPADPPVEFYPSRVMVNKRHRRIRTVLDAIVRFVGADLQQANELKNILSKELNETRIRSGKPASLSLATAPSSRGAAVANAC